jgi:hypothetical protein
MEFLNFELFMKSYIDLNRSMADAVKKIITDVMDEQNERIIRAIHDRYIRPVQEATVMRKVDVARRLNVSNSTVTQLIDTNALKSTADGRVTEYHLWQYIAGNGINQSVSTESGKSSHQTGQTP